MVLGQVEVDARSNEIPAVRELSSRGTVQVDGYADHNRLARPNRPGGALTRAACWVHARRGLETVFESSGSPIAKAGLDRIAQLYAISPDTATNPTPDARVIRFQSGDSIIRS